MRLLSCALSAGCSAAQLLRPLGFPLLPLCLRCRHAAQELAQTCTLLALNSAAGLVSPQRLHALVATVRQLSSCQLLS